MVARQHPRRHEPHEKPLVSIIIPAFNAAAHILETLNSIAGQTYDAIEIIVVDDGSTDGTGPLLKNYLAETRCNLKLILQDNQGVSGARNTGLQAASGKYAVFLDADDLLFPDMVETGLGRMENDHALAAVFFMVVKFSMGLAGEIHETPFPVKPKRISKLGPPDENRWFFLNQNFWPPGAVLVRTQSARDVGGFSPMLSGFEDQEFFFRLGGGGRFLALNRPGLRYRIYPQSVSADPVFMNANFERMVQLLRATDFFEGLSSWKKSLHFMFSAGTHFLLRDSESSKRELRKSIRCFPLNLLAIGSWMTLMIFEQRALSFFNILRRWIP